MADSKQPINFEQARALADILLAAAYADGAFVGSELHEIERILCDVLKTEKLPKEIRAHISHFNPDTFNLLEGCARLRLEGIEERRSLLRLVADIIEADEIHHMAEDAFVRRLATGIGCDPDEYAKLTVEVVSISSLAVPPPIPEDG